ncbi:unnamed protein product [Rotaria sordida]|uniref:PBZ-type domain-containing protein n=1 Tax=Rotaria sordida TaxID=392033 RepID=A0A814MQB2_9BILA|nr:unnamed protein product [Rotaria sordida]CAF1083771.1 unnamed protein product [Rotaria sordida]
MGADGSRLSFQQKQEQTESLMQQNVEIAEHLSKQHAAHKKKPDTVLNEVGKNMFAHVKLINNGANAPNQMEKIEIEGVTYEIFDFISKGGFGQVYKARAGNNNRIVAIKIMKNTPDMREEVQNEIRFLSLTKTILLDNHPKDPVERSSAKATLMQMKGHPALHYIIESLHESFCPVDDVCRMRVPDDIHQQLAKLAKPGHFVRASDSSSARSLSESRRPCRYGRNCYNHDADHRKNFAHPGDSNYHVPGGASSRPLEKQECRYGADCYRVDADHLNKYAHPIDSSHHSICGSSHGHSSKPNCRYGAACYDKDPEHRSQYAHPNGSVSAHCAKTKCSYGANCTKMKDPEHMAKFRH